MNHVTRFAIAFAFFALCLFLLPAVGQDPKTKEEKDARAKVLRKEIDELRAKIAKLETELLAVQDIPYIGPMKKSGKQTFYSFKVGDEGHLGDGVFFVDRVYGPDLVLVRIEGFRFLVGNSGSKDLADGAAVVFKGTFSVSPPSKWQGQTYPLIVSQTGTIVPK